MADEVYTVHEHAPAHLFRNDAVYMITAGTWQHIPYLRSPARKTMLKESIDFSLSKHGWTRIAWVILDNHYHMLVRSPDHDGGTLSRWINDLHKYTAGLWNKEDRSPGRRIWYEYWDRCIDHETSFYARINYIHWNPVKHGYTTDPAEYLHSSYLEYFNHDEERLAQWQQEYPWDRVSERDEY